MLARPRPSGSSRPTGRHRPVGVSGLFRQYNAPADFVETANTIGLPHSQFAFESF
jgi:hypothetical protein